MEQYYFPFGMPLTKVEQQDRSPKKLFVLGVYASAVHARWIDKQGRQKVAAMAVASEPTIFWTGENTADIIAKINVPAELGKLVVPGNTAMNGPSGRALDQLFLQPMGLQRGDSWLCDLLPVSRVNPGQRQAINNHYTSDIIAHYGLPPATIPDFNKQELNSASRREAILDELIESEAETLMLLGDLPIQHFLKFYSGTNHRKLADFGETPDTYGRPVAMKIGGRHFNIVALCHPRQAGQLGSANIKWTQLHNRWLQRSRHDFPHN
jgi:hypothetical protein